MKSVKLTALLTTIAISTTMALPVFATESTSNTVAPGSTTTESTMEYKELTFDDMYVISRGTLFSILDLNGGVYPRVNSIISGYPDGTFRPYNTITKAEVAEIIANSMEYVHGVQWFVEKPLPVMSYKDVNKNTPAYAAIKECYEAGVFKDSPDGLFKPDKMLTQAEAVTILASKVNEEYLSEALDTKKGTEFVEKIPNHWSKNSYALLGNKNVFRESEIKLDPDAYISRIDLVCMLENLFWDRLPRIDRFTAEQNAMLEYEYVTRRAPKNQDPLSLPYYVTGITDTIQYTTKFSDISDLKEYQKYALTRCVEK